MIAAPVQCDVDGIPKGSHDAKGYRRLHRPTTIAHRNSRSPGPDQGFDEAADGFGGFRASVRCSGAFARSVTFCRYNSAIVMRAAAARRQP